MKDIVWDSSILENLPPYQSPSEERDEEYAFKKFGRLTILYVKRKLSRKPQICHCLCECGRIVDLPWYKVKNKMLRTCGQDDCPYVKAELFHSRLEKPAILERLKPKIECTHEIEGCIFSKLFHICCWECDRSCKQCENSPKKCGALKRE